MKNEVVVLTNEECRQEAFNYIEVYKERALDNALKDWKEGSLTEKKVISFICEINCKGE